MTTLFTVQGLPKGARIRTAVMDEYDGMVYNVTDGGPDLVERVLAAAIEHVAGRRGHSRSRCKIAVGRVQRASGCRPPAQLSEIRFSGDRAEELRRGTYVNTDDRHRRWSTSKLRKGDEYSRRRRHPGDARRRSARRGGASGRSRCRSRATCRRSSPRSRPRPWPTRSRRSSRCGRSRPSSPRAGSSATGSRARCSRARATRPSASRRSSAAIR